MVTDHCLRSIRSYPIIQANRFEMVTDHCLRSIRSWFYGREVESEMVTDHCLRSIRSCRNPVPAKPVYGN